MNRHDRRLLGERGIPDLSQVASQQNEVRFYCPTHLITGCEVTFSGKLDLEMTLNLQSHMIMHLLIQAGLMPNGLMKPAVDVEPTPNGE